MRRLTMTLAAALVATLMVAPPALANYACLEQYEQNCINTGWQYGQQTNEGTWYNFERVEMAKCAWEGKGWWRPPEGHHNDWNTYPVYCRHGQAYVRARCLHGQWGYRWAKSPHSEPPPPPITRSNMIQCPP